MTRRGIGNIDLVASNAIAAALVCDRALEQARHHRELERRAANDARHGGPALRDAQLMVAAMHRRAAEAFELEADVVARARARARRSAARS